MIQLTLVAVCVVLAYSTYELVEYFRKPPTGEDDAFADIQRFIFRLDSEQDLNKASKMVQWFKSQFGDTPKYRKLAHQLGNKVVNGKSFIQKIAELN